MIAAIKRFLRSLRRYQGAEQNRLTAHSSPQNRSADTELQGPNGADALRAWSRKLVRDNAYAWGVVDTIVSSVVGTGINLESTYQSLDGMADIANVNETRQQVWEQWCKVCELTGRYSFDEVQQIAQREIVEAGECLIHFVNVPLEHKGIKRPVPLAIELIEADRLAQEYDTYFGGTNENGNRIVRGVELDDEGRPVAYWIYPEHPRGQFAFRRTPERIEANRIQHLFRQDRIGQSRGTPWFAPVLSTMRDLGVYIDNELQSSAISACDMTVITTETPLSTPSPGTGNEATDEYGNPMEYYEPGRIYRLRPGEGVEHVNPSRPNSNAGPWISLMLRGIAVGTGLSFETVARDYSGTNYSSNRASQLEDRRRFRQWQQYLKNHLCNPTWHWFCDAAAMIGLPVFPSASQLADDRELHAPAEWHPQTWEWVDPVTEQQASENSIKALQSTHQIESGKRGSNWERLFRQAAKEQQRREALGLLSIEEMKAKSELMKAEAALLTAKAAQQNADTNAMEVDGEQAAQSQEL